VWGGFPLNGVSRFSERSPMSSLDRESGPHARRLRSGRISVPWRTYFVTKCTESRRTLLGSPAAAEIIIQSWAFVRGQGQIKLLAFVVMPDHYHVVIALLPGGSLSKVMNRVGSFTANQIRQALGVQHRIWQDDGFYDRACRDDAEVREIAEYIHHNPVRKGLVERAEDWLFSSAHPSRRVLTDWEWWV